MKGFCSKTVVSPEIIGRVHDMVSTHKRVKLRKLGEAVDNSTERIRFILHNELQMKKLCVR